MNRQEKFWQSEYAHEYILRNSNFDVKSGISAWQIMLSKTNLNDINSILEFGCNIGRNIEVLEQLIPNSKKSIVEISPEAFNIVTNRFDLFMAQNTSILESNLDSNSQNLVFTSGVLIHVEPNDLLETMAKMFEVSNRYILICEMFSRTPKTVHYRESNDLLFTRDFGRFFLQNFNCSVVDYGFLWGHYFDDAGFDDANFWLFEKNK
jgi:pseudaminic acid biosynthesis-associated methylase